MPIVSAARLASLLDCVADGIIVADEKETILVVNKACEHLFGEAAAEMPAGSVKMIMPPEFAEHYDRRIAEFPRTGTKALIGIGRQMQARHRDGMVWLAAPAAATATRHNGHH